MRSQKILGALIFLFAITGVAKSQMSFKDVEGRISNLVKAIKNETTFPKRVTQIKQEITALEKIEKNKELKKPDDDLQLSFLIAQLKNVVTLPSADPNACHDKEIDLMMGYEPKAENGPTTPSLKESIKVLKILCGMK